MRIAYLVNQYPMISHSFIRREIQAIERQGLEVMRLSLRGWDSQLIDEQDQHERERTRYVLREGSLKLFISALRILLTRPAQLAKALALAWKMSRRAERPFPVHVIYLAEACQIALWLRSEGIQHLHAHFGTNSAEVAMLTNVLGGPTWSMTVHGTEEFDKAPIIGLSEKVKRCAFAAAISSYGRSQLYRLVSQEHWPKISIIPCGLEQAFHTVPATNVPAARRIVCVGRLSEPKGQLLLIEATSQLAQRGCIFELVLAGDGEMRDEIEALIAHHKLESQVRITGWIDASQVRDEILAARSLVLPSFAEGLPVVIMEAMALRRPVISTYVGGIPELVQPNKHGWLIPAGDVEALADALQTCLETPESELTVMGDAARERVLDRHDVETSAARLAELFRGLAS